jgi:hypothetical protein
MAVRLYHPELNCEIVLRHDSQKFGHLKAGWQLVDQPAEESDDQPDEEPEEIMEGESE